MNEIQEVYRLQGVNINDKHIETIARQMMRWVKIEDVGDTEFLVDEQVDKFRFLEENERVISDGRASGAGPAAAARHHEGVALDRLVHLGGVVPGNDARAHRGVDLRQGRSPARPEGERHDGPADSGRAPGFEYYRHVRIPADEPPPPPALPQPSDDELELERDMEYFVEPEEALGPRTGDLGVSKSGRSNRQVQGRRSKDCRPFLCTVDQRKWAG